MPRIIAAVQRMVTRKVERARAASFANRAAEQLGDLNQTMHGLVRATRIFGDNYRIARARQQRGKFFNPFKISGGSRRKTMISWNVFDHLVEEMFHRQRYKGRAFG